MMKFDFSSLFKKSEAGETPLVGKPFPKIERTPLQDGNKTLVVLFMSLTCSDCVDLLPNLNQVDLLPEESLFIYLSNASEEETSEIIDFFHFDFEISPTTDLELEETYGMTGTPHIVIVHNGIVQRSEHFKTHLDLNSVLSQFRVQAGNHE